MFAAERVYGGGEDAAEVANTSGLDPDLLESWVLYLTPRDIPRPHMLAWREASPGARSEEARAYGEQDRARIAEWNTSIEERWRGILALRPEMEEPPPRRPEVLEGTDRFFYDVHFHEDGPLAVSEEEYEDVFSPETFTRLRSLTEQLEALEKAAPPTPPMASAVADVAAARRRERKRRQYRAAPGLRRARAPRPRRNADQPRHAHTIDFERGVGGAGARTTRLRPRHLGCTPSGGDHDP